MKNSRYQISYTQTTEKCYGWNRKNEKKNFEFVEVENMIKVHDEINFFNIIRVRGDFFFIRFGYMSF